MGFAKRIVRKSVRRATPRSVRKVVHPVRTVRNAATPRPVRKASRAVYTVTNPLGAAENAAIGAVLYPSRSRRGSSRTSRKSGGRTRAPGSYAAGGAASVVVARPATARSNSADEGAASLETMAGLMAVQRERFAPATRPLAPKPEPVDLGKLRAQLWQQRKSEASVWRRRKRLELSASVDAQARDWLTATVEARNAELDAWQQSADAWWNALVRGESAVLTAALTAAFADNPAPVFIVEAAGASLVLVVVLPMLDVLPTRRAYVTPGGRLSRRDWTKTDLNEAYAQLLGAHLLATLRETWAVAPSVQHARVGGVVAVSDSGLNVLFDIEADRDTGLWDDDQFGNAVLAGSPFGLNRVGRTGEVAPWPPDQLPKGLWPTSEDHIG